MRTKLLAAAALILSIGVSGMESPPKITVSGVGTAKVLPTALEVMITLTEKSEDAKGALLNLKATRDKIAAKLSPLGVKSDDIKAEAAIVVDEQNNRNRQQMRGGNRLKRSEKTAEAKPETQMQQVIRARVPLSGKDVDALTLEGEDLKAKIKAAKLIDEKKDDEAESNEDSNGYNNQGNASPVSTYFVADIKPETQELALADAIKKASEDASRIAKAIGKTAPELISIVHQNSGQENAGYNNYYYDEWGGRRQYQQQSRDSLTSYTPSITYQTMLTAEYKVK